MIETIIKSAIGVIVSGALGYCISAIKNYKKKLKAKEEETDAIKEALIMILQSNLSNTFYVYEKEKKIPDYLYKNWRNSFKIYEALGGDDYIHTLADRMQEWGFIVTDILER